MPFQGKAYQFNDATVKTVIETGGVYGLFQYEPLYNRYVCKYVGKAGNMRERLCYWLNNPPASGITHFFGESIATDAARTQREAQLIKEFQPVGNTLLK
jgi:excinuclease UvrABC nuclease subunit